jgi:hypothetical protein
MLPSTVLIQRNAGWQAARLPQLVGSERMSGSEKSGSQSVRRWSGRSWPQAVIDRAAGTGGPADSRTGEGYRQRRPADQGGEG